MKLVTTSKWKLWEPTRDILQDQHEASDEVAFIPVLASLTGLVVCLETGGPERRNVLLHLHLAKLRLKPFLPYTQKRKWQRSECRQQNPAHKKVPRQVGLPTLKENEREVCMVWRK